MMALEAARPKQLSYFDPVTMDLSMFSFPVEGFPHYQQDLDMSHAANAYYDTHPLLESADLQNPTYLASIPATPPSISASNSAEPYLPTGSAASGQSIASASSSAMGSPYSGTAHAFQENWVNTNHGLGLPAAVMNDLFSQEYMGSTLEMEMPYQEKFLDPFVDPSLIQSAQQGSGITPIISFPDQPTSSYTNVPSYISHSPAPSPLPYNDTAEHHTSPRTQPVQHTGPSPLLVPQRSHSRPLSIYDRRSSISSIQSRLSQPSPALSSIDPDEDTKEKSERPEKCPILNCEYHIKGFARKYDKNRHTLTHYKGTMVCGFCPGSGSPAEKSFNRADVFKRHLTSVHGVEQTPPNCRKRSPGVAKKGTNYSPDATGKCSTCSSTFSNAQDFYEHLDDCVLRVVQQEEPSEAINQQRLAEVASDEEVKKTMEKHKLHDVAGPIDQFDYYEDQDDPDAHDPSSWRGLKTRPKFSKGNILASRPLIGSGNAISKNSSKPRAVTTRRRNNRGNYPQSWGCPSSSLKTRKRVLCVFDGNRRLWKDEMMLNNEFEVRLRPLGGVGDGTNRDAYITDLDVETLKRAEGVHNATQEERGPWLGGPSPHLMGQPAMLLPELCLPHDDEISLNELMA
ncbi:Zinc finger, C2H2-like [Penicillium digitatum]|uniref:Zinc finger, C2H2-like n=1 Tax=Penicillium digitatum TaxID=36651 RepID=A0A7T7BPT7_PENDI|nr:Zinc finger, C2H2-like [Penicillium digitatum]